MQTALYFVILCLIYEVSELSVQKWISSDYWFLSGWIIGIIIAMVYKAIDSINFEDEDKLND